MWAGPLSSQVATKNVESATLLSLFGTEDSHCRFTLGLVYIILESVNGIKYSVRSKVLVLDPD